DRGGRRRAADRDGGRGVKPTFFPKGRKGPSSHLLFARDFEKGRQECKGRRPTPIITDTWFSRRKRHFYPRHRPGFARQLREILPGSHFSPTRGGRSVRV